MKLRIQLNTVNRQIPVDYVEIEAHGYFRDPRDGSLSVTAMIDARPHELVVYAAGVWRSIIDVGAFKAAVDATRPPPELARENTRRNQAPRPVQTA